MENDTDTKPALTPEEWAHRSSWREYMGTSEMVGTVQDDHASAALLLHSQPFGFTWADVDALGKAADIVICDGESFLMSDIQRIAERIAALLPPRE